MNRRQLLSSFVALTGLAAVFPVIANAERKRGGDTAKAAGPVLVDPKDAQAKAVNYGAAHKDITDKALQTERAGVKWLDQKCLNCAFYDKTKEVSVGGVKAGPCAMPFAAGKVVTQTGWCSSWAKKS
jgi:hypothetical protein